MLPRLLTPAQTPHPDDRLIVARLEGAGYRVVKSDKTDLYYKVLGLLGGLEGLAWLTHEMMLRLCADAQIRKGRAYTLAELKSLAQPQAQVDLFYRLLADLALQGAFLRGYALTCPYCGLTAWTPPHLEERQPCQGCLAVFQPPLELPFAYQPNSLLSAALRNGATSLLLFLHQMRAVSSSFIWGAGYQVSKGAYKADLDLVTLLGDVLTVIECKDELPARESAATLQQITQQVAVAQELGAEAFLLATLAPSIPAEIQAYFDHAPAEGMLQRLMGRQALVTGRHQQK